MPKYKVELEDGRKFIVEADSQPSEEEVLAALAKPKGAGDFSVLDYLKAGIPGSPPSDSARKPEEMSTLGKLSGGGSGDLLTGVVKGIARSTYDMSQFPNRVLQGHPLTPANPVDQAISDALAVKGTPEEVTGQLIGEQVPFVVGPGAAAGEAVTQAALRLPARAAEETGVRLFASGLKQHLPEVAEGGVSPSRIEQARELLEAGPGPAGRVGPTRKSIRDVASGVYTKYDKRVDNIQKILDLLAEQGKKRAAEAPSIVDPETGVEMTAVGALHGRNAQSFMRGVELQNRAEALKSLMGTTRAAEGGTAGIPSLGAGGAIEAAGILAGHATGFAPIAAQASPFVRRLEGWGLYRLAEKVAQHPELANQINSRMAAVIMENTLARAEEDSKGASR